MREDSIKMENTFSNENEEACQINEAVEWKGCDVCKHRKETYFKKDNSDLEDKKSEIKTYRVSIFLNI